MNVYRDLDELPDFVNGVITIGTFDGVHTGHQKIIQQLKQEASRIAGETIIVSFHPHPRKIIKGGHVKLINTLQERIELLSATGIEHLVIVPFTKEFAELSAEQYIKGFLIRRFSPHTIIIGYDHKFGKNRLGDYQLLEKFSQEGAYLLKEIPAHLSHEISVSSTRIREYLAGGDMEEANRLLGYDFFFEGMVVQGNKLGRTIGYPTANLHIEDQEKIVPADGVYAVDVDFRFSHSDQLYGINRFSGNTGMMNIGMRPTVKGKSKTIEINIFHFDGDIYGKNLRVIVKKFLRPERQFAGLEELKDQLAKDKAAALREPLSVHLLP